MPAFVLGQELSDLADRDARIVVLTADLASANRTVEFKARHPERFFDLGIAEKNMITTAAGMASCGMIPFAATFASFCALLGAEQIRTDCAYPRMPVRIIGHHTGISMGFYGTSHHALEDLAIMRAIADLTVVCACDANQLRAVLRASVDHPGAMYIRLGRGRDVEVYPDVPADFAFGRAARLREGQRHHHHHHRHGSARHASTPPRCWPGEGIEARVVDMHTIKPLDAAEVRAAACRDRRDPDGRGAQRHRRPRQRRRRGFGRARPHPVPPPRHPGRVRAGRAARRALRALQAGCAGIAAVARELLGRS